MIKYTYLRVYVHARSLTHCSFAYVVRDLVRGERWFIDSNTELCYRVQKIQ